MTPHIWANSISLLTYCQSNFAFETSFLILVSIDVSNCLSICPSVSVCVMYLSFFCDRQCFEIVPMGCHLNGTELHCKSKMQKSNLLLKTETASATKMAILTFDIHEPYTRHYGEHIADGAPVGLQRHHAIRPLKRPLHRVSQGPPRVPDDILYTAQHKEQEENIPPPPVHLRLWLPLCNLDLILCGVKVRDDGGVATRVLEKEFMTSSLPESSRMAGSDVIWQLSSWSSRTNSTFSTLDAIISDVILNKCRRFPYIL